MRARMPDDHQMRELAADEPLDPRVARAARALRAEVGVRREWRDGVLANLERATRPGRAPDADGRRRLVLAWPTAVAAAAALFAAGLLTARHNVTANAASGQPVAAPATTVSAATERADSPTHFVLVAPDARRVALVGDFNLWNPVAAPMRRMADTGLWELDVDLPAGRHVYAFVVDGDITADPAAPRTGGDDFGRPNSVVLVSHSHT